MLLLLVLHKGLCLSNWARWVQKGSIWSEIVSYLFKSIITALKVNPNAAFYALCIAIGIAKSAEKLWLFILLRNLVTIAIAKTPPRTIAIANDFFYCSCLMGVLVNKANQRESHKLSNIVI